MKKEQSQLVAFWLPKELLDVMDNHVEREDTDRSKFIRRAIRHKVGFADVKSDS